MYYSPLENIFLSVCCYLLINIARVVNLYIYYTIKRKKTTGVVFLVIISPLVEESLSNPQQPTDIE